MMTGLSLLARGATAKVMVEGPEGESTCFEIPEPLAIMSLRQVKIDAGARLTAARRLAERWVDHQSCMNGDNIAP